MYLFIYVFISQKMKDFPFRAKETQPNNRHKSSRNRLIKDTEVL